MLDEADLAYMRETQAAARPQAAELFRRTTGPDGRGGRTATWADQGEPIAVRIMDPVDVPEALADRYGPGDLAKVTTDLVALAVGDQVRFQGRVYELVATADVQAWTTALENYARRVA